MHNENLVKMIENVKLLKKKDIYMYYLFFCYYFGKKKKDVQISSH
jgi:hypothetical protein